jgi:hypothetical protein
MSLRFSNFVCRKCDLDASLVMASIVLRGTQTGVPWLRFAILSHAPWMDCGTESSGLQDLLLFLSGESLVQLLSATDVRFCNCSRGRLQPGDSSSRGVGDLVATLAQGKTCQKN